MLKQWLREYLGINAPAPVKRDLITIGEVRQALRSEVREALNSELKVTYIDYPSRRRGPTGVCKSELRALLEREIKAHLKDEVEKKFKDPDVISDIVDRINRNQLKGEG